MSSSNSNDSSIEDSSVENLEDMTLEQPPLLTHEEVRKLIKELKNLVNTLFIKV